MEAGNVQAATMTMEQEHCWEGDDVNLLAEEAEADSLSRTWLLRETDT